MADGGGEREGDLTEVNLIFFNLSFNSKCYFSMFTGSKPKFTIVTQPHILKK